MFYHECRELFSPRFDEAANKAKRQKNTRRILKVEKRDVKKRAGHGSPAYNCAESDLAYPAIFLKAHIRPDQVVSREILRMYSGW